MPTTRTAWVALANAHRGKLLRCECSGSGHPHVQIVETIHYAWEGHEHHRPSPLTGRGGHDYAGAGHEREEDERRFARQFAEWLDDQLTEHQVQEVNLLIAPASFLGAFRKVCPSALAHRLAAVEVGDLTNCERSALQAHPRIRPLLPPETP